MPITSVTSDAKALTLTVIADYPVSVARLWDAYADPRQLEKFWGPVEYPATFVRHDMAVGGESHYWMTGPNGERPRGYWKFLRVEAERLIEVEDGFSDDNGRPDPAMPTMRMSFTFETTKTGSRFTSVTHFTSVQAMEQLVGMGMLEGMKSAMGQIDAVLADLKSFASHLPTHSTVLSDTQIRASRVIRGTVEQVWRAHHEPALLQKWLLGPDGWTMPVCVVAKRVGDKFRYEWKSNDGKPGFGFEGKLLETNGTTRAVTSERMVGMPGPSTRNELTLTPVGAGTLLSLVITYPTKEMRDQVVGTGMLKGMEASYARMEGVVLGSV